LAILTTVTLASTNSALPDDGVTVPKHVGAVLMLILILILNLFLRQFICASVGE
jgi:uncharacterized membrane protein YkvI